MIKRKINESGCGSWCSCESRYRCNRVVVNVDIRLYEVDVDLRVDIDAIE